MSWTEDLRRAPRRYSQLGFQTNLDKFARMPWGLVAMIIGLAIMGAAMLYSSTINNPDSSGMAVRHFIRFCIFFVLMMGLAITPLRFWLHLAFPAYAATLLLLIAVEFIGVSGGGAERWLKVGPIRIQPSELMKIALVLALARYYHIILAENSGGFLLHLPVLALIAAPAFLVMRQPDLGTALTLVAVGLVMVYFAGLYWRLIFASLISGLVSIPIVYLYLLKPYQIARIETLWNPKADPLGAGYQSEQAKIAIGSGGWNGKGFTQGTQSQLDFIPEQHTDFIFTVIAEEFGFLGSFSLLTLWACVIVWGVIIGMRSYSLFGRFAAIGAVATIAFYVMFNIGMVAGLLPVVGIPLPLISYGGTAMLTVMAAFGLILSVDIHREAKPDR